MKTMDLNNLIAWTIRIGVSISLVLLITGISLALYYGTITYAANELLSFGIFVLFATPIMRVIISALSFIKEKDGLYALITLLVLANIMIAIFIVPRFII